MLSNRRQDAKKDSDAQMYGLRRDEGEEESDPHRAHARGDIKLDRTGKINGRGAYLCDNPACLRTAQKRRSLQRSLDTAIPDEIFEALAAGWEVSSDG